MTATRSARKIASAIEWVTKAMVFFVSILPLVVDLAGLTPLLAAELAVTMMLILSAAMWSYALAAASGFGVDGVVACLGDAEEDPENDR